MRKLHSFERSKKPALVFKTTMQASLLEMAANFIKSDIFRNATSKGGERETPVKKFFEDHLPNTYRIVKGEVVDLNENRSPQLDIMIYDGLRNFPFFSGESYILPAEALLVSIEVKSSLKRKELIKSLKAANKLKSIKPYKEKLSPRRTGGKAADKKYRYFHCVFAYNSDLSIKQGIQGEFHRLVDVSKSLNLPLSLLDRLYITNRGLINPDAKIGRKENSGKGEGLMNLYMDILNFLIRENRRRDIAPYIDYAGRMSDGLVKF